LKKARVDANGNFPDPSLLYSEWQKVKAVESTNRNRSLANWTCMGPSVSSGSNTGAGRVNCINFNPDDPAIIWVGTPAGGLWKSEDNGNTWVCKTDKLPVLGVSDIAINPANSSIMYIATGDKDGSDTYSIGVLKSTDGGETWNTSGLNWIVTQSRQIRRLLIDPSNPDILYAGTSSGLYKTYDAGYTWNFIRSGSFKELEFKPGDYNTLYYASQTQVYKSTNGGSNWTSAITGGLPTSSGTGRIALGVTPANPDCIYALYTKSDYSYRGLYKSTDNGVTWTLKSSSPNLMGWSTNGSDAGGQSWYDLAFAVSPINEDLVYVGGVNVWKSPDAGTNWVMVGHWYGGGGKPYVHADEHALEFIPGSNEIFSGNDGGIYRSSNNGYTWEDKSDGLYIMQFYRIAASVTNPDLVIGGAQDNGTNMYNAGAWSDILGGDGMDCMIDHTNENVMYASSQYGSLNRSDDGGWSFYDISPESDGPWVTPMAMDPSNNEYIYAGYTDIYKSLDGGMSWVNVTNGFAGGIEYDFIVVAPSDGNYIYATMGTKVIKSTDGGATWSNIAGLPLFSVTNTWIEVKEDDPNTIYATFSGYSANSKVYKSTDGGSTWTNITGTGLPNLPVNCIVYEKYNSDEALYIGTDVGVYYKNKNMSSWIPYNDGFPNVDVRELEINYTIGKLRAGTYGRGLWETDLYSSPTSVGEKNTMSGVAVYPNPSTGLVNINIPGNEEALVDIINPLGQIVATQIVYANSPRNLNFDLAKQSRGVYFVKVSTASAIKTRQLILAD